MTLIRVRPKWRPKLGLVLVSVLLAVLALPVGIVLVLRAIDRSDGPMDPAEIAALAASAVLTLVVAFVLTRTITGPIDALVLRAGAIARHGRAGLQPLERYGTREFATLSQSFLDLATQLVDRNDYVQSFAQHVSHELKSPLTSIKGAAELLRDETASDPMTPEERRRFLDHIVADADRLSALLGRLREVSLAELSTTPGDTDVAAVAAALASRFPALEVVATGETARCFGLPVDAAVAVFGHVAENSAQHGATRLELRAVALDQTLTITVADNGTGFSPGSEALALRPFYSTRREQGGTGMGLAIAHALLAAHRGSIRIVPATAGATVEILVPVTQR